MVWLQAFCQNKLEGESSLQHISALKSAEGQGRFVDQST